ncbi:MAG: hypothetical protein KGS60_01805 [Verrucomicrobia bacterium]|nr:hypothetical protein [Verrucomicrobiota bacterium]
MMRKTLAWILQGLWLGTVMAEEPRLSGSWGDLHGEPLVPAALGLWTDLTGAAWNVQDHGVLGRIGAGMMNAGEALVIGEEAFVCDSPLMTRDGDEWVFPANHLLQGLAVTRRVRLDRQSGTVRYLEALRNPTAQGVTVTVELRTQYNGNIGEWRSDRGTLSPLKLGDDEEGIVVQPGSAGHDRLLVYSLCQRGGVSRPALATPSRFSFHVRYEVGVPPGETVFLLHGLAQRPPGSPPRPDMAVWAGQLPDSERERVANLPSPQLDDARSRLIAAVRAELGEIPPEDTLFLPGRTRLPGKLKAGPFTLATLAGERTWKPGEAVALEVGADGTGRIFLGNGEVWRGALKKCDAVFVPSSGTGEIALNGSRELRWVRGGGAEMNQWPEGIEGYLETQDGQRFALVSLGANKVSFNGRWGNWNGTLDQVDEFVWVDGDPWLNRRDGARLRAFPADASWTVNLKTGGSVSLPLNRVRRMVHRMAGIPSGSVVARLLDGERLVGGWTDVDLEVQGVSIKASAVRLLRRVEGDRVTVSLWDGGEITGPLAGGGVSLVSGGAGVRIGLPELERVVSSGPELGAEERTRIVDGIARLGDPQWEKREEATRWLAGLGIRARAELAAALAAGNHEPEVRHRLQCLLTEP